jgi:hypothetical protein
MARDVFDIPSGEFVEDFTGTISDVAFVEGTFGWQTQVTVTLDEAIPKQDGTLMTEKTIYLGLPDDWRSTDGFTLDKIVNGAVDPEAKISRRNKWGNFVGCLQDLGAPLREKGTHLYSATEWATAGYRCRFETIDAGRSYKMNDRVTGEPKEGKTKGYVAPTEFLGVKSGSNGQAPKAFDLAALALPDATYEALNTLAQGSTADEFMVGAVKHRSESADPVAFMDAVKSGALYERLAII